MLLLTNFYALLLRLVYAPPTRAAVLCFSVLYSLRSALTLATQRGKDEGGNAAFFALLLSFCALASWTGKERGQASLPGRGKSESRPANPFFICAHRMVLRAVYYKVKIKRARSAA